MTAKEKEHDEHERKEAQKEFEKKLMQDFSPGVEQVTAGDHVSAFRQVFQLA